MENRTFKKYGEVLQQHPGSIAFARIAAQHLADGDVATALRLAQKGVSLNPGYAAGWIVLAEIQCAQHRYSDARRALANAEAQYPGNAAVEALRARIDAAEGETPAEHSILDAQKRAVEDAGSYAGAEKGPRRGVSKVDDLIPGMESFLDSSRKNVATDARSIPPSDPGDGVDASGAVALVPTNDEDESTELERLAHTLESARLSVPSIDGDERTETEWTEPPTPVDFSTRPVTRTLAEIYAGQGNIHEAIEMYLTLCARYPENRDEYISRIADLRGQLDRPAES